MTCTTNLDELKPYLHLYKKEIVGPLEFDLHYAVKINNLYRCIGICLNHTSRPEITPGFLPVTLLVEKVSTPSGDPEFISGYFPDIELHGSVVGIDFHVAEMDNMGNLTDYQNTGRKGKTVVRYEHADERDPGGGD